MIKHVTEERAETKQPKRLLLYEKNGCFVGRDNNDDEYETEYKFVEITKEEAYKTEREVTEVDGKYYIEVDIENVRVCSKCGRSMVKGYCIDGGTDYYCSDECLLQEMTWEEWLKLYGYGETESYYTEWEEV